MPEIIGSLETRFIRCIMIVTNRHAELPSRDTIRRGIKIFATAEYSYIAQYLNAGHADPGTTA